MNVPEIPQKVKDYFWVLAMMLMFSAVSAVMNKVAGNGSTVPPPPQTIQVSPVVVGQAADGTMRILQVTPSKE